MKVQDLAKSLRQHPREFMKFLQEIDVRVKSPSAKLDPQTVSTIRELFEEKQAQEKMAEESQEARKIQLHFDTLSLSEFAQKLEVGVGDLMKVLLSKGLLLNLNSKIDFSTGVELAAELNIELSSDEKAQEEEAPATIKEHLDKIEEDELEHNFDQLVTRPPIITIMGHVDHGKTLLLDTIRKANVVASEAGGITQHIGAYQVSHQDRKFTFLDTPGHAAFTALRARGAQVTDIAILVVAADEGLKPQSIEAIDHAKAAGIKIIVAMNKMDKPDANVDRVKQQLSEHELLSEDWGGDTIMVPVSAKTGEGIDELLDMIQLVADMLELKANPDGLAKGVVIESRLSKKLGPVGTVLVKTGILKVGSFFSVGAIYGKVRALINDRGESVKSAEPGMPVEIMGFDHVPQSGEIVAAHATEKEAKALVQERELAQKKESERQSVSQVSLESISKQIEEGDVRKLHLLVKADVQGSLEAIIKSIGEMESKDVEVVVIRSATGPITQNDVMLAKASNAIMIGFGVKCNAEATKAAEEQGVEVKLYKIIYEILDDVQKAVEGLFKVEYEEIELGRAEVREIFSFSKIGTIAGSYVTDGELRRNSQARVLRGKKEVFKGTLNSLKRFKEDVGKVKHGFECGIVIDGATFEQGDIVVGFEVVEKKG